MEELGTERTVAVAQGCVQIEGTVAVEGKLDRAVGNTRVSSSRGRRQTGDEPSLHYR